MQRTYNSNVTVKSFYESLLAGDRPNLGDSLIQRFEETFPITALLTECWSTDPNNRPTAADILQCLNHF
jgi:hypothetical protein